MNFTSLQQTFPGFNMKRLLFFQTICVLLVISCSEAPRSEALNEFTRQLQKSDDYDAMKRKRIDDLQLKLAGNADGNLTTKFELHNLLFEEYRVFNYDSAYRYALQMKKQAAELNDASKKIRADINLGFCLLSSGMFKETLDSMGRINLGNTPDSLKAEYYAMMGRYFYDLGDYDKDQVYTPVYNIKAAEYIDSALAIWQPGSYPSVYFSGLKYLKTGRNAEAKTNFSKLLQRNDLTPHQLAITASTLSDIYIQEGNIDQAIKLLAEAASADIISSTKETSAAFSLANQLYKKGDVKTASTCINKAIADAVFYGARQRKIQVSAILPLIEAQKLNSVESQKQRITLYAVLVTLLLLAVIGLAVIVYRQVQKLKAAQKLITDAHRKELEINHRLIETNHLLSDANKIKEEYIGYFFGTNSDIFTRIEKFKKTLEQKIAYRKMDEIISVVNNINLKKEKEELLRNFDRVFLKLFPNFVAEFNSFFSPEDRVVLKDNELLNTDLRIFALIRMGIHDNEKIAEILEYSVHTINTYKTKVKNKSIIPNEEFEGRIMKIRTE